ncbi:1,4-alpha-glucan branching protein GlgB [Ferruginibacter yonginensis]|uniref:1,4-alpha-glucan branching enzyme n=1 Tax=Ferruginibacter yonginensis TaxID=1310416 RepID=A0ABV8QPC5_9BACT
MAYEDEHFIDSTKMVWNYSLFNDDDIKLFKAGKLFYGHEKFGCHSIQVLQTNGFYFAVWAPNATAVSVIGEFNGWKHHLHPLFVRLDESGIWEGFIPRLPEGVVYKYYIKGFEGKEVYKADPYAFYNEKRPGTASITKTLTYSWEDDHWMQHRKHNNALQAPWSVYEVHLGSWMRPKKDDPNLFNTYLDLVDRLVPYVKNMGFTHVEFMPITEYPYDGSWGYQCTGFFAATSRFGTTGDLMYLIDQMHRNGIGVILDWVPSHFPADEHGLYLFDGTHTYEYADMRKGFHKDWNSYIFNYKRAEVRSFLLSSAHFWLKYYHIDGLRVDAVNSIIRLDFSRNEGEWEPNELGGSENLEAISFLQEMNTILYREFPDIQTIAEEASDWPGITHAVSKKGFGFGMKWMMGWMHDSFKYFKKPWSDRVKHQNDFTFSIMYFYDEKFMLPLSHDEVVHGKSPMLYKMPGNEFQQHSNLKLLYTCMYTHPGAKLLFMGNEFAQTNEWDYNSELQWELLQFDSHNGMQECVRTLNHLYKNNPSFYEWQFDKKGFVWEMLTMENEGIMAYRRRGKDKAKDMVIIINVSSLAYNGISIDLKGKLHWKELFNSDDQQFWGSGLYMNNELDCKIVDKKKRICKINLNINAFTGIIIQ